MFSKLIIFVHVLNALGGRLIMCLSFRELRSIFLTAQKQPQKSKFKEN